MTKLEDIRSRGEGGVRGKSATEESRLKATKSRRLVDKGQRKGGMETHCKALLRHGGRGVERKWY